MINKKKITLLHSNDFKSKIFPLIFRIKSILYDTNIEIINIDNDKKIPNNIIYSLDWSSSLFLLKTKPKVKWIAIIWDILDLKKYLTNKKKNVKEIISASYLTIPLSMQIKNVLLQNFKTNKEKITNRILISQYDDYNHHNIRNFTEILLRKDTVTNGVLTIENHQLKHCLNSIKNQKITLIKNLTFEKAMNKLMLYNTNYVVQIDEDMTLFNNVLNNMKNDMKKEYLKDKKVFGIIYYLLDPHFGKILGIRILNTINIRGYKYQNHHLSDRIFNKNLLDNGFKLIKKDQIVGYHELHSGDYELFLKYIKITNKLFSPNNNKEAKILSELINENNIRNIDDYLGLLSCLMDKIGKSLNLDIFKKIMETIAIFNKKSKANAIGIKDIDIININKRYVKKIKKKKIDEVIKIFSLKNERSNIIKLFGLATGFFFKFEYDKKKYPHKIFQNIIQILKSLIFPKKKNLLIICNNPSKINKKICKLIDDNKKIYNIKIWYQSFAKKHYDIDIDLKYFLHKNKIELEKWIKIKKPRIIKKIEI